MLLLRIFFIITWALIVCGGFILYEKYHTPDLIVGNISSLQPYMEKHFSDALREKRLGCGGFAIIANGEIITEQGYGIANPETSAKVDTDSTLFLLSSLSKAVTTWGAMALVESRKIALDEPILPYLSRWRFPKSEQYAAEVTLRYLLSHTAGLVDGYGYSGYSSTSEIQTIEQSLSNPTDANSGAGHPAIVVSKPGSMVSYSSAGFVIVQLLMEEISGQSFNQYMKEHVLVPLGMIHSSYDLNEIINQGRAQYLATQYDMEMNSYPPRYYTNMAGVSLRSSIHDLALLAAACSGKQTILTDASIQEFARAQPGTANTWGLGHTLYTGAEDGKIIFGHGGGAFPASGADMRISEASGNAIVIVASGSQNFISKLADDWMYWETGIKRFDIRNLISEYLLYAIAIFIGGVVVFWVVIGKAKPKSGNANY